MHLVKAANMAIVIGCLLQAVTFWLLLPQLKLWRTTAKDTLADRKKVSEEAEEAARKMRMDHHRRVSASETAASASDMPM